MVLGFHGRWRIMELLRF
jgi:hypothetical protein